MIPNFFRLHRRSFIHRMRLGRNFLTRFGHSFEVFPLIGVMLRVAEQRRLLYSLQTVVIQTSLRSNVVQLAGPSAANVLVDEVSFRGHFLGFDCQLLLNCARISAVCSKRQGLVWTSLIAWLTRSGPLFHHNVCCNLRSAFSGWRQVWFGKALKPIHWENVAAAN